MKKRTLSLMLALLMILSVLPVSAAADAPKSGTCGENLTWTLSDDGVLTISGSGAMTDYGPNSEGYDVLTPWDAYINDVKSIVISSGVTSIGSRAFAGCGITSIVIPDSVKTIGKSAFADCTGVTSADLGKGVTAIGKGAFAGCSFTEITIPDSVKTIDDEAFMNCRALVSITLPKGLTAVKSGMFSYCKELKSVVVPAGVKVIDRGAFFGCTALESVYLPSALEKIEPFAFFGDNGLPAFKDVYFAGTETQWKAVSVGSNNDPLKAAAIHYGVSAYPFTDVDTTGKHMPFADAILWAANEGITTGYGNGIFKPDLDCTRAQVVTFLWRAAGEPAPKSTSNPFADVSAKQANGKDNPYYTAILWAVGEGITLGVDKTHFAPDATVTRAQFVTFLWRYENKPAAKPGVTLKDLGTVTNADFKSAILWAAGEGITTGYGDGSFRPNAVCTRAHVVTFIYRDMAE